MQISSTYNKDLSRIIIIGKPNVGKSTLYNCLLGKKEAIVGEQKGLTRDYQEKECIINNIKFILVDTAGLAFKKSKLEKKVFNLIENQIKSSTLVFFVIDGSQNLTNEDDYCGKVLRKLNKNIVLLVNKSELKKTKNFINQGFELGFGNLTHITAKNKDCKNILYPIIKRYIKPNYFEENISHNKSLSDTIIVSISGKPNTGKSTLFNLLFKKNRVVTGEKAGTTRDSIAAEIRHKETLFKIIDTAGIRKKNKLIGNIERSSTYYSRKEIRYANVSILVFDSTNAFSSIDLNIANYIISEGRSILLIFNKWDLVKEKIKYKQEVLKKLEEKFFDIKGVNCMFISALSFKNREKILDKILDIYLRWNTKINSSTLNKWFKDLKLHSTNITYKGKLKLKYINQTKVRPPSFSVFCNSKSKFSLQNKRYLVNRLVEKFNLEGTPIRISVKSARNPYLKKN